MKKSDLATGILYLGIGVLFLLAAICTDSRLDSLLFGFAGAGIAPGILMVYRYFYWSSQKKKEAYAKRLENENIELHDERKVKLRDKSGRYAYGLGLIIISISAVIFSVLGMLEIVDNARTIVIFLGGYFVFQYAAGIAIYKHLLKKF